MSATHAAVAAVWRIERARLLAGLVRLTRSLDEAEELAQEALLAALSAGPRTACRSVPAPGS